MRRMLFALFLCPVLALSSRADDAVKTQPVVVPFEILRSKHMAVSIMVNGKGPYRLIFDTGAPTMLVNNKVAREAGLVTKDSKRPPLALFGTMGQFTIKSLKIGDLVAENVNTVVMDHPTVQAISEVLGPIDGIVGFPFFARYRMTIDYQAKEMTFVPTDYKPGDIMERMMAMLMSGSRDRSGVKVLAPTSQWGLRVDKDKDDDRAGVVVQEVYQGGAADQAGIKAGDRILTVDGRWTDSAMEMFETAGAIKPGRTVPVKLLRSGNEIQLTVTPKTGF